MIISVSRQGVDGVHPTQAIMRTPPRGCSKMRRLRVSPGCGRDATRIVASSGRKTLCRSNDVAKAFGVGCLPASGPGALLTT